MNKNPYLEEQGDYSIMQLPWPPSVNKYWKVDRRRGRVYVSAEGKMYRRAVLNRLKTLRRKFHGQVDVSVTVFPPTRRKYDLDNMNKALLDALTDAGVWVDDSQVYELHSYKGPPEKSGRIMVMVSDRRDQLPF